MEKMWNGLVIKANEIHIAQFEHARVRFGKGSGIAQAPLHVKGENHTRD